MRRGLSDGRLPVTTSSTPPTASAGRSWNSFNTARTRASSKSLSPATNLWRSQSGMELWRNHGNITSRRTVSGHAAWSRISRRAHHMVSSQNMAG